MNDNDLAKRDGVGGSELSDLVICTTERSVKFGDKTVCSWREVFDRKENKKIAIVEMNHADFLENKDWEELTKQDAEVIAKAFTMLVNDMNDWRFITMKPFGRQPPNLETEKMTDGTNEDEQLGIAVDCPNEHLVVRKLNPMNEAPKDGTEILAYHKEGKNFHPVKWRDWKWMDCGTAHWNVRWNEDYRQYDCDYLGWIPYPKYDA